MKSRLTLAYSLIIFSFCYAQEQSYKDWFACSIIAGGDTIQAKIKPKDDYCLHPTSPMRVLLPNQKVKSIEPSDIAQLWIPWQGTTIRYVSIRDVDSKTSSLYRIIVDGKCQLLYNETRDVAHSAIPIKTHYIWYKNTLHEAKLEADIAYSLNSARRFEKSVSEVLKDCPQMAAEVANMKETNLDIAEVVKHLNQCLDKN